MTVKPYQEPILDGIIAPIEKAAIKEELKSLTPLRITNYAAREIYELTHDMAPQTMQEIGRLREISFRLGGGGTGKAVDIDSYDTDVNAPFKQLIVWCPEDEEIVGGYRFLEGNKLPKHDDGTRNSPTAHLFDFSERFIAYYLPRSLELGRSFIQPKYQFTAKGEGGFRRGLYSLDNLWDGLGAILKGRDYAEYYFGKVTMYPSFNPEARDAILYFIRMQFPDKENLMQPRFPVQKVVKDEDLAAIFTEDDYRKNYKILNKHLKTFGTIIPPLINAYMNLSPTMKSFGTSINHHFGEVEETGMLIKIQDIHPDKKDRHWYE